MSSEHLNIDIKFDLDKHKLRLRKAKNSDLKEATKCINKAYDMWLDSGYKTKDKTLADVTDYFLKDGHIVENQKLQLLACTCIKKVKPLIDGNLITVPRNNLINKGQLLIDQEKARKISNVNCLYFYGLAVAPNFSNIGLGNELFKLRLRYAKENSYKYVLLETGKNTWLVAWYEKLGFQIIAEDQKSNKNLNTVIMCNKLD